jgi:hypothetical protein
MFFFSAQFQKLSRNPEDIFDEIILFKSQEKNTTLSKNFYGFSQAQIGSFFYSVSVFLGNWIINKDIIYIGEPPKLENPPIKSESSQNTENSQNSLNIQKNRNFLKFKRNAKLILNESNFLTLASNSSKSLLLL